MTLDRGTVVLVELDPTVGHEQRGVRPCIAVSDPSVNADQRFPLIAVVPVTGTAGVGATSVGLNIGITGGQVTTTGIANITLTADSVSLDTTNAVINAGTRTVTLQPKTADARALEYRREP